MTLSGSIFPDFDFLPGIVIGEPAAFHHGVSHSLAFAIFFGALVFIYLRSCRERKFASRAALSGGLAYAMHIFLDAVSANEAAPIIWPLSETKFGINLNFFGHFHHGGLEHGLWSVVRWDNVPAIIRELTIIGTPALLLFLWKQTRGKNNFSG